MTWPESLVALAAAFLVGLVAWSLKLGNQERDRWERFKVDHNCKAVVHT